MLADQILPLSLTGTLVATSLWYLLPRLRVRIHKERPQRGFLLYEICLMFEGRAREAANKLQLSMYVSLKKGN